MTNYAPAPIKRYEALLSAFRDAPQQDGRFTGTGEQQGVLALQMRSLFDDPVEGETVSFDWAGVMGLVDDLATAEPRWSVGQYLTALGSLIEPR